MSDTILITGGRVIDTANGFDDIADVLIINGRIAAIGTPDAPDDAPDDVDVIDADGLIVSPGLIDMRVVTGEPGLEHKETLATAGAAAAAGGVTTMVVMPQTEPAIDDLSLVDHVQRLGQDKCPVNVRVAGALTKGLDGQAMTEIGLIGDAGAVMFSNGDHPITDTRLMRRMFSYGSTFNALIAHRPVDPYLDVQSVAHESDFSSRLGLASAPAASEVIMAQRDVALAELTGGRLLIDLVSAGDTLAVIQRAKAKDLDVAASVSINHLALNEMDIGDYRTFAKLSPPLREESDRAALLRGVSDGTIDVIVSSHDPCPAGGKRRPFADAEAGAVGLEILLAAGMTLVADGQLDLTAFLQALTANPAALLGLDAGKLSEGARADVALIDPGMPWVCDADKLRSKSKNTPFDGRMFTGRVVRTLVAGRTVFDLNA